MLVIFGQSSILSTGNGLLFWSICKLDFGVDQKNRFLSIRIDFNYTSTEHTCLHFQMYYFLVNAQFGQS